MSAPTVVNTPERQRDKVVSAALIKAAGGVEAAEGLCRVKFRRLSEYGRPDNDCFIPLDVIDDLEAVTHGTAGWPLITRHLAARRGFTLVALPQLGDQVAERGLPDVIQAISRQMREHGEAQASLLAALADGRLTAAEIDAGLIELDDEIEAIVALRALLQHLKGSA